MWDVPFTLYTPALQASLASQLVFDLSTSLTKLSILALIWRLVSLNGSPYKYAVLLLATIVALDVTIFFFLTLFQCR